MLSEVPGSREHKTGSCPQKNPRPVTETAYLQVNVPWDLCLIEDDQRTRECRERE